jgi:Uma2 family endonuclease
MGTTATRMTAEQYYAITVEGDRKQLVEGEIIVNEPKTIHAHLQLSVAFALRAWVEAGDRRGLVLMPTDIAMDEHNVFGPDVLWFSESRQPPLVEAYPDEVPDLCVEIRSSGTWRYDVGAKKAVYERGGLPELWLVDHAADTVLVYRRSDPAAKRFDVALELTTGDTLASPQLPDFALALDELFKR